MGYRKHKVPQTFSVTYEQVRALELLAYQQRRNKSVIIQEGIDLVLHRYQKEIDAAENEAALNGPSLVTEQT